MFGEFDAHVALVTGGNSGLGRATALAFARKGARVVIAARRSDEGRKTVSAIRSAGGEAMFFETDVSRSADVQALVNKVVEVYGRLDYACNAAGIEGELGPFLAEQTEDNFERVIATNLKGVWLCMKYEIPPLLEHGGSIVNISSVNGVEATPGGSLYGASKAAVVNLTRTAAVEYAEAGIRVNAINAGFFRTAMLDRALTIFGRGNPADAEEQYRKSVPMKRIGASDEIARTVIWLCSDAASYITGGVIPVDGGLLA